MAKSWIHRPASPPTKECPGCGKWIHSRSKQCPACETVITDTSSASGGTANKRVVRKKVKRRIARQSAPTAARNGDSLEAAIQFVELAGGLPQARAALDTIERIRGL